MVRLRALQEAAVLRRLAQGLGVLAARIQGRERPSEVVVLRLQAHRQEADCATAATRSCSDVTALDSRRRAPLPLVGRGRGWGWCDDDGGGDARHRRSSRIWATRRPHDRAAATHVRARRCAPNPTDAERKLWWHLRHRLANAGTHFRRQVQIGRYIADFASHKAKLIIEVDGGQHGERSRMPMPSATKLLRSKWLSRPALSGTTTCCEHRRRA